MTPEMVLEADEKKFNEAFCSRINIDNISKDNAGPLFHLANRVPEYIYEVRRQRKEIERLKAELKQCQKEKSAALRTYGKFVPEDKNDEAWEEYLRLSERRQVG